LNDEKGEDRILALFVYGGERGGRVSVCGVWMVLGMGIEVCPKVQKRDLVKKEERVEDENRLSEWRVEKIS
jgi:hypothetical protein